MAAILRLWALTSIPPGLYHDEAINGLDALSVLDGNKPIYFTANNGREPLFIYGIAASIALLGRSPGAIRIVAALLGTLAVPAVYLMALEMNGRRTALLAAMLTATTVWPLALSRIGLRAISMPLLTALALWLLWRGRRTGQWWHFVLAGLCFGAAFYTYLAARFSFIALLGFGIIYYFFHLDFYSNNEGRSVAIGKTDALLFLLAAILVLFPLLLYGAGHWDIFMGRAGQVSILNSEINKGDFWGCLLLHTGRALGMFFVRGDFIPRHNVPLRPVFDPLIGAAFILGLFQVIREWRKPDRALIIVWLAVMILPTIIAEDSPHFLRSVGLQPILFLVPALGLETIWRWLTRFAPRVLAASLVAALLIISLSLTVRDYFFNYGTDPELRYSFETAATDMAVEINRFLGTGWQGEGFAVQTGEPVSNRHVYMDERLWRDWPSVQFLAAGSTALHLLPGADPPVEGADAEEILLVSWPYDESYRAWLNQLPPDREILVRQGSLERGDLEETAYPLYFSAQVSPGKITSSKARLEGGLELIDYQLEAVDDRHLHVILRWRAVEPVETNYTAFVQLLQNGQPTAQDDAPPGTLYLPTSWWRVGDIIVGEHTLELNQTYESNRVGQQLVAGLYEWPSLKRLFVIDKDGSPQKDYILLNP